MWIWTISMNRFVPFINSVGKGKEVILRALEGFIFADIKVLTCQSRD